MSKPIDVFTRNVHTIRVQYAMVCVLFLVLAVALFYLGGPSALGWWDCFSIFLLMLALLSLFLLHGHMLIQPVERMTRQLNEAAQRLEGSGEDILLKWNGRDELANLAAAGNRLLEWLQRREQQLLEENRRVWQVVRGAEVELVRVNSSGAVLNVIHVPRGMKPVPGLTSGNSPDAHVWGDENIRRWRLGLEQAHLHHATQTVDLVFDGEKGGVRYVKAFITEEANDCFPIVVFRDERTPAADETSRHSQKAQLAAGIAHDLNNVLTVIRNGAAACRVCTNESVQEALAIIDDATAHAESIVNELRTLGGSQALELKRMAPTAIIDGVRSLLMGIVGTSATIEYEIAESLPQILVDCEQLYRVFANIVKNAVEANQGAASHIVVSAQEGTVRAADLPTFSVPPKTGRGVFFRISDNGPGIPSDVRERLFEPYVSTKAAGHGLGLATARSIVESHNGGIRVVSSVGLGASFEVFIPIPARRTADEQTQLLQEFPGGEVLVVDDDAGLLRITAILLRTLKIAAHVADCREDAIKKFCELSGRLRAVFLDAHLKDASARSILASMHSINPAVPVVIVSGSARCEIDEIFRGERLDAFLAKPYTLDELKNVFSDIPITPAGGGIWDDE